MQNPETLAKMTVLMDKVAVVMVVDPPLLRPVKLDDDGKEVPLPYEERVKGRVYTDTVAFTDRAHILAYTVGKVSELERFRQQSE
jgi:hypothetical protein